MANIVSSPIGRDTPFTLYVALCVYKMRLFFLSMVISSEMSSRRSNDRWYDSRAYLHRLWPRGSVGRGVCRVRVLMKRGTGSLMAFQNGMMATHRVPGPPKTFAATYAPQEISARQPQQHQFVGRNQEPGLSGSRSSVDEQQTGPEETTTESCAFFYDPLLVLVAHWPPETQGTGGGKDCFCFAPESIASDGQ